MNNNQLDEAKKEFEKWDIDLLRTSLTGDADDRIIILHHNRYKDISERAYLAGYKKAWEKLTWITKKTDVPDITSIPFPYCENFKNVYLKQKEEISLLKNKLDLCQKENKNLVCHMANDLICMSEYKELETENKKLRDCVEFCLKRPFHEDDNRYVLQLGEIVNSCRQCLKELDNCEQGDSNA